MKEKIDLLNNLNRRVKPTVPKRFFNQFVEDLMDKIEQEDSIIGQLKKTSKPALPDGYFERDFNFNNELDNDFKLSELKKAPQPALSTSFFTENEEKIMASVSETSPSSIKKGRIIKMRWVAAISVAAVFAIIITAVNLNNNVTPNTVANNTISTENEVTLEADDYLTYLDEEEMIDYIIENDIEITDESEEFTEEDYEMYMNFSEQDLEDYYIDL